MDKFGVGDEFVHELSMSVADFPIKSYLIKQRRAELNRQVKITTTPGLAPGAQYSFKLLLKERIKDMVGTSPRKKMVSYLTNIQNVIIMQCKKDHSSSTLGAIDCLRITQPMRGSRAG